MNMSAACTAPTQPAVSRTAEQHPRFPEYRNYRAAMSRQLVTGMTFDSWLARTEEKERGRETVFHTLPGAPLAQGWYKHKFAPVTEHMTRFGPFTTEAEAWDA